MLLQPPVRAAAEALPGLTRRACLQALPLLLALPLRTPGADTFDYVENGKVKQLTELEARDALTKKVDAATAAGKGIDVDRRGGFNEKALFSEDFYFKYGLRPNPAEVLKSPFLPPQAEELPFSPIKRRYTGYSKFSERIANGVADYSGGLRTAIQKGAWDEVAVLLEKGVKGKGSNADGGGTGIPASPLRSSCRALGLFANTVLQSENDSGTTTPNLLARHVINELYFSMDDIASAAASGDTAGAKSAWMRGKEYLNCYLQIVNMPIIPRVGDKFALVEGDI